MTPLTKETFMALWGVLLDNFKQARSEMTCAFIYQTLLDQDPDLSQEQFGYAVQQCLINCKFMPSLNEVLRQLYEPDMTGCPAMPDIDPRYADEYQLSHYYKALNVQQKWISENQHRPQVGMFRQDRLMQIPGIPEKAQTLQFPYARPERNNLQDFLGQEFGEKPKVLTQHEQEMDLETRKREAIKQLRSA